MPPHNLALAGAPPADPFRAAFEHSPVPMALFTGHGEPAAVNAAFGARLGSAYALDRGLSAAVDAVARTGRPAELPVPAAAALLRLAPLPRGAGVLVVAEDRPDDAAAEALRRSEAQARAILDNAVASIITCDTRGVILSANPATERLLGYRAEELVGRPVHVLMPPDEAARHGESMRRYLTTGERHVIGIGREVMARRRDGSQFAGWLALSEVKLPGHHVFVATINDISVIKQAERALKEAKEAAELADRAKSAFLSNMSHELRTPLNGILGFADVIHHQMLGPVGAPTYVTYASEIRRSGELLLANINDLLEMATIEAGNEALEESLVDVHDLVTSCLRLVGKRAERAALEVQADLPEELPPFTADPRALKQVLLHLLSNAIKFTPDGGTIGVSARIDHDGHLVAEVFDTGIGIAEELLETVLQPFVQGDGSLARRFEGIGLGLSIAKSLVERHGGRLAIRSQEGAGTSVTIRLPGWRFVAGR